MYMRTYVAYSVNLCTYIYFEHYYSYACYSITYRIGHCAIQVLQYLIALTLIL